jgi:alkylation response protein AidB-like acyl-CoA dehydrogenase
MSADAELLMITSHELDDDLPSTRSLSWPLLADVRDKLRLRGAVDFPIAWRSELSATAIPSCDLPSSYGGADLPIEEVLRVFYDVCSIDLNLRDVPGGGHGRILLNSSDCSSGKYNGVISDLCQSRAYVAIAITEASAGSAITHLESTYETADRGWTLNGVKECVGRFLDASHVVLLARRPEDRNCLSAFLIPLPFAGLSFEEMPSDGLHQVRWGRLSFSRLHVPFEFMIGNEGEGRTLFEQHFAHWRLTMTAAAIGCTAIGLRSTAVWAATHRIGDNVLWKESLIQDGYSNAVYRVQAAWLSLMDAAARCSRRRTNLVKAEGIEDCLSARGETRLQAFAA